MANDKGPRKAQPAWKAAAGGPAKAASGPQFAWKPAEQQTQSRWGRRAKVAGVLGGTLGCVALIIVLIYWLRPQKGACLVLIGADPVADVERLDAPLDVYGWHGGEQLAAWSSEAAGSEHTRRNKLTPQLREELQSFRSLRPADLDKFLQELEARELNPLILYLGLHGGADANGPFVFTAGGERLYLRKLIEGFGGSRLKDKQVVLLLDTARLAPDPSLGVLLPDCVRSLKALDAEGVFDSVPNLIVICATDAGERGWSAPEWGTTGFAEMLLRGLSGAAPASHGAVITAGDLFNYVREQTQSWSRATRPSAQTPILLPANGGQERADRIGLTAKVGAPVDWPEAVPFKPSQALMDHWTTCKELEDGTPSPAVYTPRLWRRYRELLLRYEQLLRAGEESAAGKLAGILSKAEFDIKDGRSLRLADGQQPRSRGNDLPLPVALGMSQPGADVPAGDAAFNRIWQAPESDWDRLWDELLKTPGVDAEVLRARFYDFLLRRAVDPADDADKAARLMLRPGLAGSGNPRPAEAHLLVMTHQFFDTVKSGQPSPDLWKRALVVRRLAEQAALGINGPANRNRTHPYSEVLWTFLAKSVEDGDIRRRDGEDWLFSSQEAGHNRSLDELKAAAKQYDEVLAQAKSLQAAYAARDEALADLPLLTRWVAFGDPQAADGRVEDVKDLWLNKVHPLARRLDGTDRPAGLEPLVAEIHKRLDRLKDDYKSRCRDLRDKNLQTLWEEVEQVLSVPPMLIEPELRRGLVETSQRQVADQSVAWVANPKSVVARPAPAAEDVKAARRAQALQWGRLATAVLGDIPNDQHRQTEVMDASGLQNALARLPVDGWQKDADDIGDHIRRHWQLLAAEPESAADERRAEFRSRWAIAFRPPTDAEPATVNRQKRWQSLLVGLALRTARDHWYEDPDLKRPTEYFRAASNLYLADAKQMVGNGSTETPGALAVQKLLEAEALELVGFPQRVNWTSETRRTFTLSVKAGGGPGGYVTMWADPIGQSTSLTLNADDLQRQPAALPAAKRDLHVEAKPTAVDDKVKLTAHGYFRGQWRSAETEIRLNRAADLIVSRATPPNDAAVAVRAGDDLDLGAIAIVLDFSGSMAELPGPPGPNGKRKTDWKNPNSKNQQALRTLEEVLLRLPQGTPISLRLFGHATNATAQDNGKPETGPNGLSALTKDERIYRDTVTWSRANPRPLNEAILDRLKSTEPQYYTPLLRTMARAKDDFPDGYRGPKTLLVLTDGMDTMYTVNELKANLRKEFADANIAIQMVLFRVDEKELDAAQKQFAEVTTFQPPGRVWVTEDNSKLTELIDQALRPKLRLVDLSGEPAAGLARGGLPANRIGDPLTALRWTPGIVPKLYDGYVLQSRQRFNLQRGDRLLVQLIRDSTGVKFSRELLADDPQLRGRVARGNDWVLGLPRYHAAVTPQDKQLWMTATLETPRGSSPGRDGNLQQTRPAFVWWEVAPQSGEKPKALRVTERSQLPAPAWSLLAEGWPGGVTSYKPAAIGVWADFVPPPVAYKVSIPVTAVGSASEAGQSITVSSDEGKVEVTASIEDWPLRVDTTKENDFQTADPPRVSCLVMRMLYPKDKPVFARPAGASFDASQQRYYSGSSAVTVVFGPVASKDDLEAKLQSRPLELDLISVQQFKADHPKLEMVMPPAGGPEQPRVDPPNLGEKAER